MSFTATWTPNRSPKAAALYHTVGCVACHAPGETPSHAPADDRTKVELEDAVHTRFLAGPAGNEDQLFCRWRRF